MSQHRTLNYGKLNFLFFSFSKHFFFFCSQKFACVCRMGDHVSGPSLVKSSGESLSKVISADNSSIGGMPSLPFLFKVLSIKKPLSIQVHPNKVSKKKKKISSLSSCDAMSIKYNEIIISFHSNKLSNCMQTAQIFIKIQTTNRKFQSH